MSPFDQSEKNIRRAAEALLQADIVVVNTGAGMSADCPLKTYNEIADLDVYQNANLTYADLSRPDLLKEDPTLFQGFWSMCYNDYVSATPHHGYAILRRWWETLFSQKTQAQLLLREAQAQIVLRGRGCTAVPFSAETGIVEKGFEESHLYHALTPEQRDAAPHRPLTPTNGSAELPGNFFLYTSNVDGLFRRTFPAEMIYEIHGGCRQWQCSARCGAKPFSFAPDFRFPVTADLRLKDLVRCQQCGAPARPHVLMFEDEMWEVNEAEAERYVVWECSVENVMRDHPDCRLVVLEIGAGVRVPSIRMESETVLRDTPAGQTTLVRINPAHTGIDEPLAHPSCFIPIEGSALGALQKIDAAMQELEPGLLSN
eukprot:GCRY01002468.1.p1 GENE.GCRY01002468.1~~GCRY01002468.1.p1  ORF type:complete len:371 (-),score=97.49 GCRY01002468.1:297-1409(-)